MSLWCCGSGLAPYLLIASMAPSLPVGNGIEALGGCVSTLVEIGTRKEVEGGN